MTPFNLVNGADSIFLIILHILSVLSAYVFLQCIINKFKTRYTVINFFINLLIIVKMFFYSAEFRHSLDIIFPSNKLDTFICAPIILHIIVLLSEIVLVGIDVVKIIEWQKNNISLRTVKEASDKLPMGLCYYNENGLPLLINHKMNSISRILTGEALLDGNEFWRKISTGDIINGNRAEKSNKSPIIEFDNDDVRSFIRNIKNINGEKITEIISADITAQYNLSRKLKSYNEDILRINRKLEQQSENLLMITREKEILAAKISIHDKLGKVLLATKRFALKGGSEKDIDEILRMWRDNIALLKNEYRDNSSKENLDDLYDAAEIMGIKVSCKGDIPFENNRVMRFLMAGARESLTNAVRHAKAENLYISVSKKGNDYIIDYKNDGNKPESEEIKEGGGLSTLRNSIESSGGYMKISARPEFMLKIIIPK